mmetsp:Transcript_882/g.2424  ORF Transcript_882/g.2424 Transcript_882/m.2424 type:complete len:86 (+) Transcript_882:80-337(+)
MRRRAERGGTAKLRSRWLSPAAAKSAPARRASVLAAELRRESQVGLTALRCAPLLTLSSMLPARCVSSMVDIAAAPEGALLIDDC